MNYYKLIYDYENDEHYINCNIANIGILDDYCTSGGIPIKEWGPYSFGYDSNEGNIVSDYVANVYRWLIVSSKFKTLILSEIDEKNYQLFPIRLLDTAKIAEDVTCYVVNLLDTVKNAVDMEHSKYDIFELDGETVLSFKKYAFCEEKVKGHDMFRISEDSIPVFVSEKIKMLIESYNLKGFHFLKVHVA